MNRCPRDGYLVGGKHDLPADPTEFGVECLPAIGCNRIWCVRCDLPVRNAPGISIPPLTPTELAALYETPDLGTSPDVAHPDRGVRLYLCRCSQWSEDGVQPLEDDDPESYRRSPDVPWRCGGHPEVMLPYNLDGSVVSSQVELIGLVQRTLTGDAAKSDWLIRLRARLIAADAAAMADAVTACLDHQDPRVRARALRFFVHVVHPPARARLLELLAAGKLAGIADEANGNTTLEETVWDVLAPMVNEPGPVRERAHVEALGGRGSGALFRALAAGDTEWFLLHGSEMARATPPRAEELYDSFAQVPDEILMGQRKLSIGYGDAHDRVRRTIAELITLDEALHRTLHPLAAWDCSEHYRARLCIFAARTWGAMLMKADVVEPGELETWNERARERSGRVGATHSHSELVWMFEDDSCGIWNKRRELVRGDGRRVLLQGSFVSTAEITNVTSFMEATDEHVHRGVRCELANGKSVLVHEEHDDDPPKDPEYTGEYVELESAWVGHLGRDLATWLGVPHVDSRGRTTNTRQLEVRGRIHAFAADLSECPGDCPLGRYDDEDLRLHWDPEIGSLTLLITLRGRTRERVMKRGSLEQIRRYLRHFITPRRILAACTGGY